MSESETNSKREKPEMDERVDAHIEREIIPGTGGKGFVGILFAIAALSVLFWVYSRLVAPYPGHLTPDEAAAKAAGDTQAAEGASSSSPGTATDGKGAADSPAQHDMSKMTAESANGGLASGAGGFTTRLASFAEDSCPVCGMTPSKSSVMVGAVLDGKWVGFDSFACMFGYAKGKKLGDVEVLDFSTRTSDDADKRMLPVKDAYYMVGLDGAVKGAMPPGVAAFANEEDAKAAMGDLGGRIVRFDEMKAFVEKANARR